MAYSLETVSRVMKMVVDSRMDYSKKQLYNALFPRVVNSDKDGFELDRYTKTPAAMRTVKAGQPAVTRRYTPGSGEIFVPEINSEKMAITPELVGAVMAGIESTASLDKIAAITEEFLYGTDGLMTANYQQRNKAAIDLLREGKFITAYETGSYQELDYNRTSALGTDTYNFTAGSPTMDAALLQVYTLLKATGTPISNLAVIMGASWLGEFEADTAIQAKLAAYNGSFLYQVPENFQNVDGLFVVARYKPAGMVIPLTIFGYQPQWNYFLNGSAAAPFLPDTEIVMFDMNDPRTQINLGIDVIEDNGRIKRYSGQDMILCSDVTRDPAAEYIIARTKYAYIGNVEHSARCTGTF